MRRASAHHAAFPDRLADQLPGLRAKLEHQRRFRLEQLTDLDVILENSAAPVDATDSARREITVKVAAAARRALADIDVALALVTNGGYGRCRRCHRDLPLRLLQAIPASRLCLNCRRPPMPADGPAAGSVSVHAQPRTASRTQQPHRVRPG